MNSAADYIGSIEVNSGPDRISIIFKVLNLFPILLEICLLVGIYFLILRSKTLTKTKKIVFSILAFILGTGTIFIVSLPVVYILNFIQLQLLKA